MDSATALYNQLKAAEPFFLLAGPNLIESEEHIMWMAKSIKTIASKVGLPLVFQSSFDKANRTSSKSFRGPGMSEGLKILEKVKIAYDIPIVTDVHESIQCEEVGKVADIIQIPSFLCCQTDLLVATAKTGKIINIKKGQFCAPSVMINSVEKVRLAGNPNVMVCEREQCLDTSLLESRDVNWTYIRPGVTGGIRASFLPSPLRTLYNKFGVYKTEHGVYDSLLESPICLFSCPKISDGFLSELIRVSEEKQRATEREGGRKG
ncbi:hypothetical protein UlMin_012549 [Ulmus minor]